MKDLKFTDDIIVKLFGAEDAENESEDRFKQYFYYNTAYENIRANLPIRIVVGHKGVGKSALLKRSYLEDEDENRLAVWIKPNEIELLRGDLESKSLNQLIEDWKLGIFRIIVDHASRKLTGQTGKSGGQSIAAGFWNSFNSAVRSMAPSAEAATSKAILKNFNENG